MPNGGGRSGYYDDETGACYDEQTRDSNEPDAYYDAYYRQSIGEDINLTYFLVYHFGNRVEEWWDSLSNY